MVKILAILDMKGTKNKNYCMAIMTCFVNSSSGKEKGGAGHAGKCPDFCSIEQSMTVLRVRLTLQLLSTIAKCVYVQVEETIPYFHF